MVFFLHFEFSSRVLLRSPRIGSLRCFAGIPGLGGVAPDSPVGDLSWRDPRPVPQPPPPSTIRLVLVLGRAFRWGGGRPNFEPVLIGRPRSPLQPAFKVRKKSATEADVGPRFFSAPPLARFAIGTPPSPSPDAIAGRRRRACRAAGPRTPAAGGGRTARRGSLPRRRTSLGASVAASAGPGSARKTRGPCPVPPLPGGARSLRPCLPSARVFLARLTTRRWPCASGQPLERVWHQIRMCP